MTNQEIVEVREYYQLPCSVNDEQIHKELNGSLGLVIIRIEKAKKNLVKSVAKSMPDIIKKVFNK